MSDAKKLRQLIKQLSAIAAQTNKIRQSKNLALTVTTRMPTSTETELPARRRGLNGMPSARIMRVQTLSTAIKSTKTMQLG